MNHQNQASRKPGQGERASLRALPLSQSGKRELHRRPAGLDVRNWRRAQQLLVGDAGRSCNRCQVLAEEAVWAVDLDALGMYDINDRSWSRVDGNVNDAMREEAMLTGMTRVPVAGSIALDPVAAKGPSGRPSAGLMRLLEPGP
jgi:hypothetical protein